MAKPHKGHRQLRQGRVSAPGCLYFVTIRCAKSSARLDRETVFNKTIVTFSDLSSSDGSVLHALILMPDHLHLLFKLGDDSLSGVVRAYKGRMSPALRSLGIRWQKGSFFDRRLRDDDSIAVVLRYMLMNPYRKGLIQANQEWPYWHCSEEGTRWMAAEKRMSLPLPEWLRMNQVRNCVD